MALSRRANAQVPQKIRCDICLIVKNHGAFTQSAIQKVVTAMQTSRIDPTVAKLVHCTQCSRRGPMELQCAQCDKWKGLDKFSKTQRKAGDDALCMDCVKIQVDTEPVVPFSKEEANRNTIDDEERNGDGYDSDETNPYHHSGDEDESTFASSSRVTYSRPRTGGSTVWTGRTNMSKANTFAKRSMPSTAMPSTANSQAGSTRAAPAVNKSKVYASAPARAGPAAKPSQQVLDEDEEDSDQKVSDDEDNGVRL